MNERLSVKFEGKGEGSVMVGGGRWDRDGRFKVGGLGVESEF